MLCGAKTRAGGQCQKHSMDNGSGRCRNHGGASLRGSSHPQYKHGRRSKGYIENSRLARQRVWQLIILGSLYGIFNE
jgi:hypothetical protein